MGGRGASSGAKGGQKISGGRNLAGLIDNIISSPNTALGQLSQFSSAMKIDASEFTENGNSVKFQKATLENEKNKIELAFTSTYNPRQVAKSTNAIKSSIIAVTYENGNVTSSRVLLENKSSSLKNAKTQYDNVLSEWTKITGQKKISFE